MDIGTDKINETKKSTALVKPLPPDILLIVFIHGFKGTDSTFAGFPERLCHVISETVDNVVVESIVFPAYETKGELTAAVERFADWLTTLTVEREVANGTGGGAGKAKIVLCGHSMGGLLAADSLIALAQNRAGSQIPLWPNVIACIAFDTPYLGLHPFVFKNSVTKAVGYVQTAQKMASSLGILSSADPSLQPAQKEPVGAIAAASPSPSTSSWAKWAPAAYGVGGALLGGALAGTAYYKRKDLNTSYTWATDHMKYVGTLWNEQLLKKRMEHMVEIERTLGVAFKNFYTLLPPEPPHSSNLRTFIVLPQAKALLRSYFIPAQNNIAPDEIQAHTGIFEASTNDGYYELGLAVARIIREAVLGGRGKVDDEDTAKRTNMKAEESMHQEITPVEGSHGLEISSHDDTSGCRQREEGNLIDL